MKILSCAFGYSYLCRILQWLFIFQRPISKNKTWAVSMDVPQHVNVFKIKLDILKEKTPNFREI